MPAALPTPPAESEDPSRQQRIELARAFAGQLLKGVKQIGLYRHQESKFAEYLAPAHQALVAYQERFQSLTLKVEQQNFLILGQPMLTEDSNIPYKFYRDGLRQLTFRPEIRPDELVSFTLIATSEPERGAEDVLAQLWRAGNEHIEYVVVESFQMDEFSEEEIQVEVEHVVSYLQARLRSDSEDTLRFARVSTEDLDVKLDGIEQIRGAVITGSPASDELKAKLQKEIAEEESARLFPKLVNAIFQVIEGGLEDPQLLEEIFTQLLDALLLQEDFATINAIVLKLKAMEQRSEQLARLRTVMLARIAEEQRLARVAEILRHNKVKNGPEIIRYLQTLEPTTVPVLISLLETIELPENRALLLDVLASFAKTNPEPFVNHLGSERPQAVRDMVYVLEKANVPDRLKLFAPVLQHKNLAVRLEVMAIIARGRTGENRNLIAELLNDPAQQVRMLAARLLGEFDRERAFLDLIQIVRRPDFEKKTAEERGAFYAAVGATGVPQAFEMMSQLMQAKVTLLNRKKVLDDKLLAIHGLAGVCSVQAYKLLQSVVEDRSQPVEVLTAARKAMYQTKKALFGEGEAS